jgi:beta-galactosidase
MNDGSIFERVRAHIEGFGLTQGRKIISFDKSWRFHPSDVGEARSPEFNDSKWRILDVPHDFSIEGDFSQAHETRGSGACLPAGIVWYRKHFRWQSDWKDRKISICFDGVSMNSQVWINGRFLGQHPYAFTPFSYDIGPYLRDREEADNVISVRVDNSLQPYSRFYMGTGIIRHCWLVSACALHIEEYGVIARVARQGKENAEVLVETRVSVQAYPETDWQGFRDPRLNREVAKECTIVTSIRNCEGAIIAEAREVSEIQNFSRYSFAQRLELRDPKAWSPDQPNMYKIHSRLFLDGIVVDETITPLGIRTMSFDPHEGLLLNGGAIKMKGACIHQDSGIFGAAVPLNAWIKKLLVLREMGCNAIRTAHHPFPTEFYHVCDALGFLVLDEAFDEWRSGWERGFREQPYGKNGYGYSLFFDTYAESDLRAMLRRDRNHPSVVLWSVGNEIPELYYPEGMEILKKLVRICKEEDPTRPVTVAAEGQLRRPLAAAMTELLDVAGYNYIDLKYGDAYYDEDIEKVYGKETLQYDGPLYEGVHKQFPAMPILGTETGYDTVHWIAVKNSPWVIGQFLWTGYDYLGEASPPSPGMGDALPHGSDKGMVDIIDIPKPEYFLRQSLWASRPVVHLTVKTALWDPKRLFTLIPARSHWNWAEGEKKVVYCFTNCHRVELFLNGRSLGAKHSDSRAEHPLEWLVDWEPGLLKAVAVRDGAVVCEHSLGTAGAPSRIEAISESDWMLADGRDVSLVAISIRDAHGILVPDASSMIAAAAKGPGSLLGLVSGNLSGRDSYRVHRTRAFQGRLQAVIQASEMPGPIELVVESDVLEPARLVVMAKEKPQKDPRSLFT